MKDFLVTSESVTEGHPDKLCDRICDSLLDAYLAGDPSSRVAAEAMASKDALFISGEVTSQGSVDISAVARKAALEVGYTTAEAGLDGKHCLIITNVSAQSPDIARGVTREQETLGAGDQGIVYGFACAESESLMPLTHVLATALSQRLAAVRKENILRWLYPDGKSQVTMVYRGEGAPSHIKSIIVSAHHQAGMDQREIRSALAREVIAPCVDGKWLREDTLIHINPTGSFCVGGPQADTGLTGRKLMVDTYGGVGKHGGGAFSGKDPTKVDRSGAYMARYVAKNIVAAGLAKRCEVALAFAIGLPEPEAVTINTFGTETVPTSIVDKAVGEVFAFSVADIINSLALRRPQYAKTAAYGHFGRQDEGFAWEKTDRAADLLKVVHRQ